MFGRKRTYLDVAAGVAGNPSSPHEEGRQARAQLEDARREIAQLIEVQADDIIFTSGATESNALAILGYVRALRRQAGEATPGRNNLHVLYLPTSHASVVRNIEQLATEGVTVEMLPLDGTRVDLDALVKMLRKETVLVVMDAVCGETGVVWNTREVSEVLKRKRGGTADARILLHVDASQAPHTEKITRDHFGADLLTFDASKVAPMHGAGVLVAHRTIALEPLYRGGGQERGMRPGTEASELVRLFAVALRAAAKGREKFRIAAERNRTRLVELITASLPDVLVQEGKEQAPHILNFSLLGRDTDYLAALLDEAGFAVSTKSACEIDFEAGSRAVLALTGDSARAKSTIRVSWGPSTKWRHLKAFAGALVRETRFIDSHTKR